MKKLFFRLDPIFPDREATNAGKNLVPIDLAGSALILFQKGAVHKRQALTMVHFLNGCITSNGHFAA